jgi:hypothetical protein
VHKLTRITFLLVGLVALIVPAAVLAQEEPPPTTTTTTTTEPPPELPLLEQFETEGWHDSWLDWRALDDVRTSITRAYQQNGLRVNIPPNGRRGTGPFWKMPDDVEEAWFRYRIRLDDFEPITSGKLPGLAGMPNFTARGCNPSTEQYPGWSARMLFEPAGFGGAESDQVPIGYYVYHVDQPRTCGEFMLWDDDGVLDQDWWYCVEGHVKLNTPGEADGILSGWVDNDPAFARADIRFRRAAEDWLDIRTFWLNVYFGGSTIPNDRDLTLRIDDLVISEEGRVGCPTRFTDDDGNQHEPDIEWMFQNEYVYGCGLESYCPHQELTRAETAALLERILDPPATTTDFFTDDQGHWAEGVLNRLAAADILRGCGPTSACPDDPVTRGQMAALLRRSLSIPASDIDQFVDDAGNIFEPDINAIAAIGITKGCRDTTDHFCPEESVFRDQAATLLARAVKWWES